MAPLFSCIDLTVDPCFPIKLIACVDATNSLTEQNAAASAAEPLSSPSLRPVIRLKTLITASIAGDKGASGSSFPDIRTTRSGVPTGASRTRTRARVSSQSFLTSSPLRPMMLPTLRTGTMSLKTLSPGQPGHLGVVVVGISESAPSWVSTAVSSDGFMGSFWGSAGAAIFAG
uniref:Uncharacterized protein n=1 Tax=Opuntia streptacantha TaxID=393608 RepID=A0A7C9E3L0_OPUST